MARLWALPVLAAMTLVVGCNKDGKGGCEELVVVVEINDTNGDAITEGVTVSIDQEECSDAGDGTWDCVLDGAGQVQIFAFGAPTYESQSVNVDVEEPENCDKAIKQEITMPAEIGGL
jgi:hypothetical protein